MVETLINPLNKVKVRNTDMKHWCMDIDTQLCMTVAMHIVLYVHNIIMPIGTAISLNYSSSTHYNFVYIYIYIIQLSMDEYNNNA